MPYIFKTELINIKIDWLIILLIYFLNSLCFCRLSNTCFFTIDSCLLHNLLIYWPHEFTFEFSVFISLTSITNANLLNLSFISEIRENITLKDWMKQ